MTGEEARTELLLDLYTAEDSHDNKDMAAYIKGNYKLIEGDIRDPYYYTEPHADHVQTTDPIWYPRVIFEKMIRMSDFVFGERKAEMYRALTSNFILFDHYAKRIGPQTYLFDLKNDIEERINIADKHPDIVKNIRETVAEIKSKSPRQGNYYMISPPEKYSMVIPGDCSGTGYPEDRCLFIHPWVDDNADLSKIQLVRGDTFLKARLAYYMLYFLIGIVLSILFLYFTFCHSKGPKQKVQ